MKKYEGKLYIGGEFRDAVDKSTFTNLNPVTEEAICNVALAGAADVDKAVSAADRAFTEWSVLDARDRGKIMMEMAALVEKEGESLAQLDCIDAGKPIEDCREDIHAAAGLFRYFAGLTDKITGQTLPAQNDQFCFTSREPYGTIAAITAWNYPLFNASAKIAPVIGTGNACVLKPAEEAPLTALCLASLVESVDCVPKGLVNVINGPGETTGSLLTHHQGIEKLTFTGSTETGRALLRASADSNVKGLTLELGGKSPYIIFDDADLEMALNGITFSAFFNQGQTCTAGTRLIVHNSIRNAVIEGLRDRVARIKIGDPADETTNLGPLISKVQYDKTVSYVTSGRDAGGAVIFGGKRPRGCDRGYFYMPTLLVDVPSDAPVCKEEIFGPVLVLHTFESDAEAIQMANDTVYGLAASVWTRDSRRLHSCAKDLQAGIVWCNTVFAEHPGVPAGGFRQSGLGREFGQSAVEEYTRLKTVWVDLSGEHFSWI